MGELERALRQWKWLAVGAMAVAALELVAVAVLGVAARRPPHRTTDERLLGTWQSDAGSTIAAIRDQRPIDDAQVAALQKLFGKLRITYTPADFTTDLDGTTEGFRYEVLGRDDRSVAIRVIPDKPSPLDGLADTSEFVVIHFDGPDGYWLYVPNVGIREYFRRVR